ncbi:hypothetical protein OG453_12040 [Streptomyces sp. NBC_01381]|uniref:hypothetical protein n=1 Tax=Streptomyces sp. NBC_01381 TaxID=2903845 RepID=UPI00225AF23D|nr:hypothetical protein [Streptomyces sp. NBC_01381]MCX4667385.1 hypothetical protein [Streptomyces sp. NBC_01381]
MTRLADSLEAVQLDIGVKLLDHSRSMLTEHPLSVTELRFLAARLTESLGDVLRIAESRGRQLRLSPEDSYKALLDHTQGCEQCADEPARCAEGSALRRTLKEARR